MKYLTARAGLPQTTPLRLHMRKRAALVLGAAMVMAMSNHVLAQRDDGVQVTVRAWHNITKQEVGRSRSGIPIDLFELTQRVSYADLDLTTPAGAAELQKRLRISAEEACRQIDELYPETIPETTDRTCVQMAVKEAGAQVRAAIAASEENLKMRSAARLSN